MKTKGPNLFWRASCAMLVLGLGIGSLSVPLMAQEDDGDRFRELFRSKSTAAPKKKTLRRAARPGRGARKATRKRKSRKARSRRIIRAAPRSVAKTAPAPVIKRLDPRWWRAPLPSRYVPGEILLTLPPKAPKGTITQIARQHALRLLSVDRIGLLEEPVYFLDFTGPRTVPEVIAELRLRNGAVIVQPNYLYAEQLKPRRGDRARANYTIQYALNKLHIGDAQDRATGRNVTIAIIDSAIDLQHPELSGSVISAYDAIARGGRRGGMPHGTAIASIIAAHGELTGVAPDARLASVRAFSRSASTGPALSTTRALLKGLDWAYGQKARIFNLSFAGPRDPLFIRALERLGKEGAILIAAAGNEGPRSPRLYPAAANTVIAVTATNNKDELFSTASQGDYVEIASPGVEILVASPGAGFGFLSGTSMAAAHVSALAALILEQNPAISTSRIRKILQTTADDLGKKGPDTRFGAGRVNALAAIRAAGP